MSNVEGHPQTSPDRLSNPEQVRAELVGGLRQDIRTVLDTYGQDETVLVRDGISDVHSVDRVVRAVTPVALDPEDNDSYRFNEVTQILSVEETTEDGVTHRVNRTFVMGLQLHKVDPNTNLPYDESTAEVHIRKVGTVEAFNEKREKMTTEDIIKAREKVGRLAGVLREQAAKEVTDPAFREAQTHQE